MVSRVRVTGNGFFVKQHRTWHREGCRENKCLWWRRWHSSSESGMGMVCTWEILGTGLAALRKQYRIVYLKPIYCINQFYPNKFNFLKKKLYCRGQRKKLCKVLLEGFEWQAESMCLDMLGSKERPVPLRRVRMVTQPALETWERVEPSQRQSQEPDSNLAALRPNVSKSSKLVCRCRSQSGQCCCRPQTEPLKRSIWELAESWSLSSTFHYTVLVGG